MSNDPRKLVQDPRAHEDMQTSHSMAEAANSGHSLQGYAALNALRSDDEVARIAYELYRRREQQGEPGDADTDWFKAEEEVRRTRESRNR